MFPDLDVGIQKTEDERPTAVTTVGRFAGLADLSAEFRVDRFTEFEQAPDGSWTVAREYPLTGPEFYPSPAAARRRGSR